MALWQLPSDGLLTALPRSVELLLATVTVLLLLLGSWRKSAQGRRYRLPPSPPQLPILGNLLTMKKLTKQPHLDFAELGKKYGNIIWLKLASSSPLVVVQTAELAEEVLKKQDVIYASRPPPTYAMRLMGYAGMEMTLAPYGQEWRLFKKFVTLEVLSIKRIQQFSEGREEEVRELVASIREKVLEPGNDEKVLAMNSRLRAAAVNNITRILLKKRLVHNVGEEGEDSAVPLDIDGFHGFSFKLIEEYITLVGTKLLEDYLPSLTFLGDIVNRKTKARMQELFIKFDAMLGSILKEHQTYRLKNPDKPARDLGDILVGMTDEKGRPCPDDLLKAHFMTLLLGGAHNSSLTMEWVFSELLRNPDCLVKAQEELDRVVGRDRRVEESDIPNLPYLDAVITEGMRMHPVIPLLIPHFSTADTKLGGYDIPANTQVLVSVHAIMRNPAVWERPDDYIPERHLKGNKPDLGGTNFHLLPFGSGRRVCPGINYGLTVVHIVLARLLHSFNWHLPGELKYRPQDLDMRGKQSISFTKLFPLKAVASVRLADHLYPRAALNVKFRETKKLADIAGY